MENNKTEIIIFKTNDEKISVEVLMENETVWLTQEKLAELFGVDRTVITKHLKHIYEEEELEENSTSAKFAQVQTEGNREVKREVMFYNLDVIIAVGYRVNSKKATQFRIWATKILKEYIIKGFAMDDERLKNVGGGKYWKELLDRIKNIRSSEKVLYRQVLDLYATSIDYDSHDKYTKIFFAVVQNKLHYAANGKTAAEIISERVDADKPFMGLMTFGENGIRKSDVMVAKNYLTETEIKRLNNVVSAYFDIAELRAIDHIPTTMADYIQQLDKLILSMDRKLLSDAGKTSHIEAEKKALEEYIKYQNKTLSSVEQSYLESIKTLQEKAKKKSNPDGDKNGKI